MLSRRRWLPMVAAALALFSSCGYGVTGKADLLPGTIKTIAIPAWGNPTERYKVGDRLAGALTREFISRTRYAIVADPNQAEAVLTGRVLQVLPQPTVTDPASGRAAGVQVLVIMQMRLTERATGKILFDRPQFEARQRYEISIDAAAYFEESSSALDRLARDVAREAVSAILEGF
jgi:Lipopolysaccharide-assembly